MTNRRAIARKNFLVYFYSKKILQNFLSCNEQKVTKNEQNVTSNEQKLTSNEQKVQPRMKTPNILLFLPRITLNKLNVKSFFITLISFLLFQLRNTIERLIKARLHGPIEILYLFLAEDFKLQKRPFRGVLEKRCSENMQQIYRRTPMPKCDFNKVPFSEQFFNRTPLNGCFWNCLTLRDFKTISHNFNIFLHFQQYTTSKLSRAYNKGYYYILFLFVL